MSVQTVEMGPSALTDIVVERPLVETDPATFLAALGSTLRAELGGILPQTTATELLPGTEAIGGFSSGFQSGVDIRQ